jgi:hypothetical protein
LSWWEREIVEPGKLPLLLCFVAFVLTFLVTRAITRLIRAGRGPFHDVTAGAGAGAGGTHVHHAVPGVLVLVVGAFMAIGAPPSSPWREVAAVAIGIGASLVLDEFALIFHMEDVYWSEEGQLSVQAVAVAVAYLGFVLVGLHPFGVDDVGTAELSLRLSAAASVALTLVLFGVCLAKGKYRTALVALFVPLVGVFGAVRLARPGSRWFRSSYSPARRAEARARADAFDARWSPLFRRLGAAVAGRPSPHQG